LNEIAFAAQLTRRASPPPDRPGAEQAHGRQQIAERHLPGFGRARIRKPERAKERRAQAEEEAAFVSSAVRIEVQEQQGGKDGHRAGRHPGHPEEQVSGAGIEERQRAQRPGRRGEKGCEDVGSFIPAVVHGAGF